MTDAYMGISVSRDGSHTKSDFIQYSLGEVGAFETRVVRRHLCIARQLVVTVRVSGPIKRDILAMSVQTDSV